MIVNRLVGSVVGAWLGATWATRMASATLYRVIAALLVLIAIASPPTTSAPSRSSTCQPEPR